MQSADQILRVQVEQALLRDARLSAQPIEIAVDGGIVFLRGSVQSYRRKLAAYEIAASFEACCGVRNELQVVPALEMADAEVANLVRSALEAHADVRKETIVVSSQAGVVVLGGSVASAFERAVAEDIALAVRGVRAVKNRLIIDLAERSENEALCKEIRTAMASARGLQHSGIRVAVGGDTVVLSGTVDALWKVEAAEVLARRFGLWNVCNEISVSARGA